MDANFVWLSRMQGGRVIRPFVVLRVTESQSHSVTTYPLPMWMGEIFYAHFIKFSYLLCSQGEYNFLTYNQGKPNGICLHIEPPYCVAVQNENFDLGKLDFINPTTARSQIC